MAPYVRRIVDRPRVDRPRLKFLSRNSYPELTELAYLNWLDETLQIIETQFEVPA
jgi:hypothetical protein